MHAVFLLINFVGIYCFSVCAVNETTTDIICVKCKQDSSDKGNEIVLCDQCGYGKMHNPIIKLLLLLLAYHLLCVVVH